MDETSLYEPNEDDTPVGLRTFTTALNRLFSSLLAVWLARQDQIAGLRDGGFKSKRQLYLL